MESETDTIVPETPFSRQRSRSPPRRFETGGSETPDMVLNQSVLGQDFDESNDLVPAFDESNDLVLAFDDLNEVMPDTVLPIDESDTVVPETVFPLDDSDEVVLEMVLPVDDSETVSPDSQPRIICPKSDRVILEFLAICCPSVLTVLTFLE